MQKIFLKDIKVAIYSGKDFDEIPGHLRSEMGVHLVAIDELELDLSKQFSIVHRV